MAIEVFAGDDKTLVFHVVTGPEIQTTAAAATGATSLLVRPLEEAIADEAKVRFGNLVVTLSAAAKVGDTSLAVDAIDGSIGRGERGRKVQDLTGFTVELTIENPSTSAALLTKAPTVTSAANGVCQAAITDTETGTTLGAGSYMCRLRRTNDGFETTMVYDAFRVRSI